MNVGQPPRPPRTRRRIVLAILAVVIASALVWMSGKSAESDRFYAFLARYDVARQIVRPVFVLAGKEAEFDLQIQVAALEPILAEAMVEEVFYRIGSHRVAVEEPEVPSSEVQ
jgi:hypothetical protein